MPKRLNIDYVKKYIDENTDCELLSNEYINSSTNLKLRCSCGKEFERTFNKIKSRNNPCCIECSKDRQSQLFRKDINEVIEFINSTGCKYISGEYINNSSILTIACRCGNIFNKSYAKFISGQDRCQECGHEINTVSRIKYTAEYVQEVVNKERGYNIDIDKYEVSYKPVPCTCKYGHKFSLRFDWYLKGQSSCYECYREFFRGENTPNWKGGENEVINNLRESIKEWKKDVFAYYGFKCGITQEYDKDIVIHHIKGFTTIIKEASDKLGIPILYKIKDYEDINDFYKLKQEVINNHIVKNGIPLRKSIHNKFHSLYGKGNNTVEQFEEFLNTYYNTSLEYIQKNNKSELYKAS